MKIYEPPTNYTTQILLQGPNKNIQVLYSKLFRHNENFKLSRKLMQMTWIFFLKKTVTQVPRKIHSFEIIKNLKI
jgi:hypothetical protein